VNILVINAGSSSIKTVLYESLEGVLNRISECSARSIGQQHASIDTVSPSNEHTSIQTPLADHTDALDAILETFAIDTLDVVAYRVVYGGIDYHVPTGITDAVESRLASFGSIDPEHAPITSAIIAKLRRQLPRVRHVACFDTAFFHDIPELAQLVPIPKKYRDMGIRRFGYHGLSYDYLVDTFGTIAGSDAQHGRVIYAHLGSGASIMATRDAKPIDMTMGLTPTSGLVMGTRTGDIDPSLSWLLHSSADMSIDDYQHMINSESGLLAISESSADMYTLLQSQSTDPQAALAVELFCYQARKAIASLAATIGGLDSLIFSGGMGEQAQDIKKRICDGLTFLGVQIDDDANKRRDRLISTPGSQVGVHVIPTDESLSIARSIISMNIPTKELE